MRRLKLPILFLFVMFTVGLLTLTACSSTRYETNVHEVNEQFRNISITTSTADIAIVPTDDEIVKIVCYEKTRISHFVKVQNDTLVIEEFNEQKWYDRIGNLRKQKITVYLPRLEYLSLVIEESTGDVEISKNFKFKSIDVSLSTGDVKCCASAETVKIVASTGDVYAGGISVSLLDITVSTGDVMVSDVVCSGDVTIGVSTGDTNIIDVECKNLISTGRTGEISLKNVRVAEKISITRSTGDVSFNKSDAAELFVTTSTGDVEGSLLTDKIFIVKTDTGRVSVPNSITGGRCEITTDTGDIEILISKG